MRTQITKFQDHEAIEAVLKRLTRVKLRRYVDTTILKYEWCKLLEYDGWGGAYWATKLGDERQFDTELSIKIYLTTEQVAQAVLRAMKKKHPKLLTDFPKNWTVKIVLGNRDNYGTITIWAEKEI